MRERQQGSTSYPITFGMVDSADHITSKTGLSPTVVISKNGGSFSAPSGAVTEVGNGIYVLAANSTDRNTLGSFELYATATGADPVNASYVIVAYDPFDAMRLGLTAVPNANAGAAGGLPTVDSSNAVKANLTQILGTLLTETSGQIAAAFKQFFNIASPAGTVNLIPNAPISGDLTAAMKSSITTAATAATPIAASVAGNVGGNVSGSVNSVTAGVSLAANQHVITDSGSITTVSTVTNPVLLTSAYDAAKSAASQSSVNTISTNIGTNGAGLTALGDTRLNFLNASISSISASVWGYTARTLSSFDFTVGISAADVWGYVSRTLSTSPPTANDIATAVWSAGSRTLTGFGTLIADIWTYTARLVTNTIPTANQTAIAIADLQLTGHTTAGSAGAAWTNAGAAANPWAATGDALKLAGEAGLAQWRLAQTPGTGPIAPIPAPASAGECVAYINNIPLPGIDMSGAKIYILPSLKPAGAGDFVIDPGNIGKIALIVNSAGYAAITLPVDETSGTSYHFECDRLGINNDAVLTHGVFDIATFIANPA